MTNPFADKEFADSTITSSRATDDLAGFLAGFVVGEGCFTRSGRTFTFSVGLGAIDRRMCDTMRDFFGVGFLVESPRRKPHYDDEVAYVVRSIHDLIGVVIPFMDEHLPESYKRRQYLEWREQLFDFWDNGARRKRMRVKECSRDGCTRLCRALDLCRRHYYEEYGR